MVSSASSLRARCLSTEHWSQLSFLSQFHPADGHHLALLLKTGNFVRHGLFLGIAELDIAIRMVGGP